MTSEEIGFLKGLIVQKGWQVYQEILEYKFKQEYTKFRKIKKKTDYAFAHLNGYLDGLEYAMKIVQDEIDSNTEPQPDEGGSGG